MFTVIDSPCGYGKTSYAIDLMIDNPDKCYVYITPFLNEVERIKKEIPWMKEPKYGKDTNKYKDFKRLLEMGDCIVSTHALFQKCTPEIINLIKNYNYTLILDEVMDVVEELTVVKKNDIEYLLSLNLIRIDDKTKKIIWLNNDSESQFDNLKDYFINGDTYFISNTVIIWSFPVTVFKAFSDVFVLTYMFDCQLQKYYYDFYNIRYKKVSVAREGIVPYNDIRPHLYNIHVLGMDKLNNIGKDKHALSLTWYNKASEEDLTVLRNNLYNFFHNKCHANSTEVLWTTFKNYKEKIQPKRFTKKGCFAPHNTRSTNQYKDRIYVAYPINKYMRPYIKQFFETRGIHIDQDKFAISELIQFIYRSAIRENKEIELYIPSSRMRNLFLRFCDP